MVVRYYFYEYQRVNYNRRIFLARKNEEEEGMICFSDSLNYPVSKVLCCVWNGTYEQSGEFLSFFTEVTPTAGQIWKNRKMGKEWIIRQVKQKSREVIFESTNETFDFIELFSYFNFAKGSEGVNPEGYSSGYLAGHSGLRWL